MPHLLNKGKRTITYSVGTKVTKDTHGNDQTVSDDVTIAPNEHKDVPEAAAKKLLRIFPLEIVNLNSTADMQAALTNTAPAAPAAPIGGITPPAPDLGANAPFQQSNSPANTPNPTETVIPNAELIKQIDGLDRLGLINFAEEHKLDIDPAKLKKPDELKKAILTAYEAKQAA